MDTPTIMMFTIFGIQAVWIIYLQGRVNEFKKRTMFLQDVIEDVIDKRVVVCRTDKGFQVISKESEYGSR